jgi:hypothetical protein
MAFVISAFGFFAIPVTIIVVLAISVTTDTAIKPTFAWRELVSIKMIAARCHLRAITLPVAFKAPIHSGIRISVNTRSSKEDQLRKISDHFV